MNSIRRRKIIRWWRKGRGDLLAMAIFLVVMLAVALILPHLPWVQAYEERMFRIWGMK